MRARVMVVALGLVACGSNPEDIFSYAGTVRTADGAGRADASVVLRWTPPQPYAPPNFCTGQAFNRDGTLEVNPKQPRTTPLKTVKTDQNGAYVSEVFRAQLEYQTAASCLRIETATGTGATSWVDYFWQATQHASGADLQPWLANPQVQRGDGGWELRTQSPPLPSDASVDSVSLVAVLRTLDGGVVWSSSATSVDGGMPSLRLDDEALEDFATTASLDVLQSATVETMGGGGPFGGGGGRFSLPPAGATLNDAFPLTGRVSAVSRGATCTGFATPCPLTDGVLQPTSIDGGVLHFHLARPAVIRTVVVRGVSSSSGVPLLGVRLKDVATGMQAIAQGSFDPNGMELPTVSPFVRLTVLGPVRSPDAGWQDIDLDFPAGAPSEVTEVSLFE